jgi:hypothetical protein
MLSRIESDPKVAKWFMAGVADIRDMLAEDQDEEPPAAGPPEGASVGAEEEEPL